MAQRIEAPKHPASTPAAAAGSAGPASKPAAPPQQHHPTQAPAADAQTLPPPGAQQPAARQRAASLQGLHPPAAGEGSDCGSAPAEAPALAGPSAAAPPEAEAVAPPQEGTGAPNRHVLELLGREAYVFSRAAAQEAEAASARC